MTLQAIHQNAKMKAYSLRFAVTIYLLVFMIVFAVETSFLAMLSSYHRASPTPDLDPRQVAPMKVDRAQTLQTTKKVACDM